jgi:hypothetical protein
MIELHDPVGESRMFPPERTARHGKHPRHFGRIEQSIEDTCAHEAARAGKERYDGIGIGHGSLLALSPRAHKLPLRLQSSDVRPITDETNEL